MKFLSPALFAALLVLSSPSLARADDLMFEPAVVTVSGRILGDYVMLGSGKMLKASIFWLDAPVAIKGNPESENRASRRDIDNISRILLENPVGQDLSDLAGGTVTLKGALYNEPSHEHHTDVLLKVQEVVSGGS